MDKKLPLELHLVRVFTGQTLVAGHTTKVKCKVLDWGRREPGVFEVTVQLGDGVDVGSCLVQPDSATGVFAQGISNTTTQDVELVQNTIIGRVDLVESTPLPGVEKGVHGSQGSQFSIWAIPLHTATALDRERDPLPPDMVHPLSQSTILGYMRYTRHFQALHAPVYRRTYAACYLHQEYSLGNN